MAQAFDLDRFVSAQEGVYPVALGEIRAGHKRSHWMWFVFPQLRGLGRSATAVHYGIASIDEARAYAAHPVLGGRLRECVAALQGLPQRISAEQVFGAVDAMKLRSSLTLFAAAVPEEALFADALERWFGGERDDATLDLLGC
ncbi:MAG: DUF1810 domain-containing protein [Sphingobium sp.]